MTRKRLVTDPIGRIQVADQDVQRAFDEMRDKVNALPAPATNIVSVGPWLESGLIGGNTLGLKMGGESAAGNYPVEWTAWEDGEVVGAIARITPIHATLDLGVQIMLDRHDESGILLERFTIEATKGWAIPKFTGGKLTFKRGEALSLKYATPATWSDNTQHMSVFLLVAM